MKFYYKLLLLVLLIGFNLNLYGRSAPTLLSPSNGSTTWAGVTLDWSPVSGSSYYQLQIDTVITFNSPSLYNQLKAYINSADGNTDTYQYLIDFLFGKKYYWRVRAYKAGDTSAWSQWAFTTRDYVSITSPSNGYSSWAGIYLEWAPHTGVKYYDAQADTSPNFNSPALKQTTKAYINSTDGNSDTYYYLSDIYFGKTYYWRVRARNGVDTSSWSSVRYFSTVDYVNKTSPSSGSNQWAGLTLEWAPHNGVDYYDVQADTSPNFNSVALKQASKAYINSTDGNSDTYHFLSDIYFGKTYYWRVRARNAVDTTSWSTYWTFNTVDYVNKTSPTSGTNQWAGLTLEWAPHTGVDYYDVQADTSPNFNSSALKQASKAYINSTDGNSDTYHYLSDIYFGKKYYWRVRARNGVDTTTWSSAWYFNTVDYVTKTSPTSGSSQWAGLTLEWAPHNGVDYYDVQADTSPNFNSSALKQASKAYINSTDGNSDTYHYLTDIYFGTKYYWRVRARNAVDTTTWSSVWYFTTVDYVNKTSPTSGSTTWAGLTLEWAPHVGVDYYDAQADTSINFNTSALKQTSKAYINSTDGNSDTYYYLQDIFFGKKYYWHVRARNGVDTSSWNTTWNFTTRNYVTMVSPSNGQTGVSTAGVTLDWNSHEGVRYYQVQLDTTNTFNSSAFKSSTIAYINTVSSNSDTRYATGGLYTNRIYYWRVRALNNADTSNWTTWVFTTGSCNPPAQPSTINGSSSVCRGTTNTYSISAVSGATGYTWKLPSGWTGSSTSTSISAKADTTGGIITVYASNSCGKSIVQTLSISVNSLPVAKAGKDTTICEGYNTKIGVPSVSGLTYSWSSNPSGFSSTLANPTVSPTYSTTYYLTVNATLTGCAKSDTVIVTVNAKPMAKVGSNKSICKGDKVSIGAVSVSGNIYSWSSNPSGFTSSVSKPDVTPTTTTTFYLTEINTVTGCSNSDSVVVKVNYPNSGSTIIKACNSYFFGGNTLTNSGTYYDTVTNKAGCDSVVTLYLIINKSNGSSLTIKTCDSYTFAGKTLTSTGTYYDTLTNKVGCDSVITLNLTINNSNNGTLSDVACNSYTFKGKTYTTSGVYKDTFTNVKGCDSVVTLNLIIHKSSSNTLTVKACNNYFFGGKFITKSGTYLDTLTNKVGCDSVITLNLTINKSTNSNIIVKACNSYVFGGNILTKSGTYYDTITNKVGCDSIIKLNLTINKSNLITQNVKACDSYIFKGKTLTKSGTYYDSLLNKNGCDSVLTLNLTINKSNGSSATVKACNSYVFGGKTLTTSGTYYDTLTNKNGCDSVLTLNLTINKSNGSSATIKACNSYVFGGKTLTSSGTYYDTLTNKNGCDSVLTLNLTINKSNGSSSTIKACNSYVFGGNTLTSSGTYYDTLTNKNGCDSVLTLNLTINKSNGSSATIKACNSYIFGGKTLTSSGTYYDTLTNKNGCDSILTLYLTINKSNGSTANIKACNSYVFGGNTLTSSGTYYDTLTNKNGCDSVLTLNLTIIKSNGSSATVKACNSYVFGGKTLTSSGTYYDTLTNKNGCDSILTLNLTINKSNGSSATVKACDSYVFGGNTLTSSGTYYDTLTNKNGCDSVLTLYITINKSNGSTATLKSCNSYVFGGNTLTSSGTYYDTLTNKNGCDSVLTLNLTINKSNGSTATVKACDSYVFGGKTLTSSGTYYDTLTNKNGCDSILTLNLTINKSNGSSSTIKACNSYVFGGKTLTSSGTYYDTLMNKNGCDSILTLNLTINKSNGSTATVKACNSYVFGGKTLTYSGTYYDTLTNKNGCDSVLTLYLTINKSNGSTATIKACNSYVFGGKTLTLSGTYYDTLMNKNGCDSVLTLYLTINKSDSSTISVSACKAYVFNGNTLTSSGTYYDTLTNRNGCDSFITLKLTIDTLSNAITLSGKTLTAIQTGATYQWLDCNKGYSKISGANNQSFTATKSGNYAVALTRNSCVDTSSCMNVTLTGTDKFQTMKPSTKLITNYELRVFPNPSTGIINLEFSSTIKEDMEVKVYDFMGQVCLAELIEAHTITKAIDMSGKAKGVYMIECVTGGGVVVKRVVVE